MKMPFVIASLLAALALGAHAQSSVPRTVQPSLYPDSDSITLSETERVEYNPDGTSTSLCEAWTQILTERGRREESELKLGYSKRYGDARILHVGVLDTNGVERILDVSATLKEMTDNSSLAANIVDPLDRTLVCTIPGLQVGEIVHVKIERRTVKSRIKDQWSDVCILEWTHPILKSVYEVKAPASRPIRARAIRHPLGNVTEETKSLPDGSTLYVYTATNSPRMFPEPDMPPLWTQVQSVHLSTAGDWREISRWYWELCQPHLAKTTPAMTNLVTSLDRDLNRIFKFVSQNIRYMGLTLEDTSPGYAPHDVNITFENRYGVCRDKAGLLVALLRLAGHKAFPVLINVGAKMDPEVPKPYFNHAIVAVEEGGRYILMDPTNENTKDLCPAYLCNCSYLVARPEGEDLMTSPVPDPNGNAVRAKTRGDLRDDGTLVVKSVIDFTGINDTLYRGALAKATPEQRVKFFESRMKSIQPGAELITCEITPKAIRDTTIPLHVELLAKLPEAVLRGETEDTLGVPFVTRAFSLANWLIAGNTSLEKRRYPLVLDTTALVDETVEIDLGTALGPVKKLPDETALTNDYRFLRAFQVTDGKLCAQRSHAIQSVEFPPDAYATMREDIKRVEAAERPNPAFRADGLKNAHVRVILESTDVDIRNDAEWTVTNTLVKEVLTYRGKKDSAELKFPYNPTWKNVRVLRASVSNLNGIVSHVKPVEMNEIDVSWAAAAPRYPAGKTLVVNLPAVEVGSVISVTTVTTVTNAPAPYYGTFGFDAREPLDRRHVRVGDWTRDAAQPRRIPDEASQPASSLWRDVKTVSRCTFAKAAKILRRAASVDAIDTAICGLAEDATDVKSIRGWMARHVRLAGPSLYEVPIPQQLTDPQTVLTERYASRLDYVRTLCALLKGAGYAADIVFAARNAGQPQAVRNRDKFEFENVRAFSVPVCRVRETTGGFLGFGGETRTHFLADENEYTPLEASAYAGCDFFDPETESFGTIAGERGFATSQVTLTIRENGSADYDAESKLGGAGVGAFRKRYAEILPEDFSRHYQALLGQVAKAASATSELRPDITGYPAALRFSCFVPDYATVENGTITLRLPPFDCPIPTLPGSVRQTPIAIPAQDESEEVVIIRFPEGYRTVEFAPKDFTFCNPLSADTALVQTTCVKPATAGNPLEVVITRRIARRSEAMFGPEYAELFRDERRRATAPSSRTVVVRKQP